MIIKCAKCDKWFEDTAIQHCVKMGACPKCGFTVVLPDTSETYLIRKGN